MNYLSTRNRDLRMNAPQAIAKGLAPDGGLLTPAVLPRLPASAVETMKEMSYQQRVVYIMNSFLEGFAASELTTYASEAYGGGKFSHEDVAPEAGAMDSALESLAAFLRDQIHRLRLPKPLTALCQYLAELVDGDGYLSQEDLDGLASMKIPQALTERALDALQSLEPPGVGARSLSECLLLQLSRRDGGDPVAMDIAARFLPELGRKHYAAIAQKLGVNVEAVRAAETVIAALEPHPGRAFQTAEPTIYVRPDVFIAQLEGEWKVILNEYYLPRVSVNDYYLRLLKSSDEKETKDYLRQKLQQAKWLLDSLERRGSTLRLCAEAVLEAQRPFFTGNSQTLAPMTLSALAEGLELHPSTVSRAVRGKYLQCRQGTYPLRYFFSLPVSGGGVSRQAAKQALLSLLREEDPDIYALVKAADKLCAYLKCLEELQSGNREFADAAQQTLASLRDMNMPEIDWFLERFAPAFGLTLDGLQGR